jgi:hypothetical protein
MSNDLPASSRVPASDDAAHEDGLLMHELTVVNAMLGKYVLRYLDADARRADPIPTAEEHALADRLTNVADGIRIRANRRDQYERP